MFPCKRKAHTPIPIYTLLKEDHVNSDIAQLINYNKSIDSSPHSATYVCEQGSISPGKACRLFLSQAITWTSADLLSVGPLETNVSEIWIIFIQGMHLNIVCEWRQFCLGSIS